MQLLTEAAFFLSLMFQLQYAAMIVKYIIFD